jgi:preprotein translocase subunit YajC
MFISPAYAQAAGGPGGDTSFLLMMLAVMGIFYFLLIRPQSQRAKEHREMVNRVRRGDIVVTSGGMIGKVLRVPDNSDEVEVELADNLKVRIVKSTLMDVRSKSEPVKDAGATVSKG